MSQEPVFVFTHPRACSTAFERVFMTRRDALHTFHEPFGDAWHYGPESLSERFRNDPAGREASGESATTFKDILDRFKQAEEGKRIFVKDMAYYLFAPNGQPTAIAPSLGGGREDCNPTVLPLDVLRRFHFAFLIRHPRHSVPSFYRCTVPPLCESTGWTDFMPSEAGYEELVRLLDCLIVLGILDEDRITVVDADDLLDNPEGVIRAFCERTGIDFRPSMLQWDQDDQHVKDEFAKWNGFHNDAISSSGLKARTHPKKQLTEEEEDAEWEKKFGLRGQQIIRETVDENIPHYEYLRTFRLIV
ncbi:Branched-chain-amino-acid aminotransferase-like protein 1 [Escovopsis weberi]|uniref:Branched-chain-amino-acid aminotransferase-like protein 1 n=1 Tax=Escovopsis weberi TaxID=150374 RepID=A0A0M8N4E5_ESCWE|nr:Branched-chain-amino-acid aminotransferase-like protein 1 [Escovopsis weberi]